MLGDVAGQHCRRDDADPGDRPTTPALHHRARVRGRRPRHDQHRDHGGARGAAAVVHPGGTRAVGQAGTRAGARRSGAVLAAGDAEARQGNRYEAKTVMPAGRRYIVCRNRQEAKKDAADRASIVAALERQLAKGDKALVGNTGFRRYLKTNSEEHFAIDPDKIEAEKKFDGIFVLRTNTDLNPLEAMLCYKQLWTVEQTFRTAKHLLATRPIFHKLDETIRGHVFCSFLALVLKKA